MDISNDQNQMDIISTFSGLILERGLAGFPQFGKKMPHKIYVAESNEA